MSQLTWKRGVGGDSRTWASGPLGQAGNDSPGTDDRAVCDLAKVFQDRERALITGTGQEGRAWVSFIPFSASFCGGCRRR